MGEKRIKLVFGEVTGKNTGTTETQVPGVVPSSGFFLSFPAPGSPEQLCKVKLRLGPKHASIQETKARELL